MVGWLRRVLGAERPTTEEFDQEAERARERLDRLEGRLRYVDERIRVMRR